ncbi:MAG TPA: hypothetical protein VJR89_04200 [Polyangiales bacterium]|nr:hypothetical protein [Polyangiales bacterium]
MAAFASGIAPPLPAAGMPAAPAVLPSALLPAPPRADAPAFSGVLGAAAPLAEVAVLAGRRPAPPPALGALWTPAAGGGGVADIPALGS